MHTLEAIGPNRRVAIAREMTKTFEEVRRGMAPDLAKHFKQHPPKGEVVLIIEEGPLPDDLELDELIAMLRKWHGLSLKEAIKLAAKCKQIPKRLVYRKTTRGPDEHTERDSI